jgi:hypothetical protein
LYTSFWSSGCSPVRVDSSFFSSPAAVRGTIFQSERT